MFELIWLPESPDEMQWPCVHCPGFLGGKGGVIRLKRNTHSILIEHDGCQRKWYKCKYWEQARPLVAEKKELKCGNWWAAGQWTRQLSTRKDQGQESKLSNAAYSCFFWYRLLQSGKVVASGEPTFWGRAWLRKTDSWSLDGEEKQTPRILFSLN